MTPLESRKRLLIAESDLNRVQLGLDWCAVSAEGRTLTERVRTFGAMASSAAILVAGFAAWRRGKPAAPRATPSWRHTLLQGAGLISTLWLAFRPPGREPDEK